MNRLPLGYLLLVVWLLFGCKLVSGGNGPAGTDNLDRDSTVYLASGQPRSLDPAKTLAGPGGVVGLVFSGLVTLDTNLQVQPDIAAGWQVSEDGLLYTFYLRKNALFHDGRPVTADDVRFSWERAANPQIGSDTVRTYLGDIEGVEEMVSGRSDHISGLQIIDDYTLQVRLTAPIPYFLAKLTFPVAFLVDRDNVTKSNWEHTPNGSGPFQLTTWRDDEIIILTRNDSYYLSPAGIKNIVYLMGAGIPLSMYENDEIDLVGVGGANLERVQDPNDPLSKELVTGVAMCTNYIGLNTTIAPFNDERVRQAFSYATDRERLISGLFQGDALLATGPLPPGIPGFSDRPNPYPYDPQKARELLDAAGYTPETLPPLTYVTSGYGEVSSFVVTVISMWQEALGVTVEPIVLDPYLYLDEIYAGNIGNIYDSGWCADYPDPQNFLDVLFYSGSQQNLGGYSNPELDALLAAARVQPDPQARLTQYAAIEQQIIAEAPAIFTNYSFSAVLVSPDVRGYVLTPIELPQWHRVQLERN